MDEVWMYHTGGGEFSNLDVFNAALNARYGLATSALDYSEKAQGNGLRVTPGYV
jgi:hypothetical protein